MVIAFIPARGGSKSIPLKNIKDFCGKPLLYWNLLALQKTEEVDEVYVATDSEEIADTVMRFRFSKVKIYYREEENAQDTSSTESVMLEFLYKKEFDSKDTFILVQATSPFTQTEDFENALKLYRQDNYDSLLTCVRIKRFFWGEDGEPFNYDYKDRPRRQDFEGVLMENGAFYINKVDNIIRFKNRLCKNIGIYEMPEYTGIEIDEEDDWLIAEKLMTKYILANIPLRHRKIKIFATDVDGVLTDAGMYYSENGDELKKFNTLDGKGIEILRNRGIKTAIITSENTKLVERRAAKLKIDYLYQGVKDKAAVLHEICQQEDISPEEIAYIGDDINCYPLLRAVGVAACPETAVAEIKEIPRIIHLFKKGGEGCVREFIDHLIDNHMV